MFDVLSLMLRILPSLSNDAGSGRNRRQRTISLERLEGRQLFNVDWRNPVDALDVNNDQAIAPNDALMVINALNSRSAGPLPDIRESGDGFYDVNGDQQLSPSDALDVINALNQGLKGQRTLANDGIGNDLRITLSVGQLAGVRLYRLRLEGDLGDTGGVAVYLIDPENPALALLDSGPPGTALFQLSGGVADFPSEYVQWDGTVLTLALPNFANHDTALLKIQSSGESSGADAWLKVVPLSNTIDTSQVWPPFATTALGLTSHLGPASDPNGNGVVLVSQVTLEGQTAPGASLHLTGAEGVSLDAIADANGRYEFAVSVASGVNNFEIAASDALGRQATIQTSVRYGDVILDWNASMLTVVRDWTTLSNDPYPNRVVMSPPPAVARNLAMVHAAMFDAVNAVERKYQPYQVDLVAPAGTSAAVAAAVAAQRVASTLYTKIDELAIFNAALQEALNSIADGPGKTQGLAIGAQVGDAILAWRTGDGAGATRAYTPGSAPGQWQRTFPDYYPPLLPQWPGVKPFAMTSGDQFRAPPPPPLDSAEYAAAVDEVQRLGGYSSTQRTAEQREIALFWADGGGTFTPPGHWNQIAADVALSRGESLADNARTFAMLNVALADAGISCWDAKYNYGFWRPIAAIRQAETDGNLLTIADSNWIPLLRTPNFPSYTSGHSTFSAAAAAVLNAVFGANVSFTSVADDYTGFRERPLAEHLVLTRSFTSFDEAAAEAGQSRIYGGIHFQFDNVAGRAAGRSIGEYVVANFFKQA